MVQLVLAGSQDAFLTKYPKRTYFVSVFYRRTPFFLNTIQVPLLGPARFGDTAICRIPQTGDVVVGMSLQSVLPSLATVSNTFTYVGGKTTLTMNVNSSTEYTIRIPPGASTENLTWLNVIPGITFDATLRITTVGTTTINVVSDDFADILCQENPRFTVNGSRGPDYPLELSPVWTYTNEKNISYVDNTGNKLVKEAVLKIGGQAVKRLEGEYLTLRQDLDVPQENQFALTALVGKNDTQLVTQPRTYITPLDFMEFIPMCALERHNFEVHYEFEQFSNLIPYDGAGEFSPASYSSTRIAPVTDAMFLSPNVFMSTTSNIIQYAGGTTFSNTYPNIQSGQIRNLYSNLYTFSGTLLSADTGSSVSVAGNAFGSDTQSNLYIFNQGSLNLFSTYSNTLSKVSNTSTFSFPSGFVTSTIKYINLASNTIQTSSERLRITSNAAKTQNTVAITNFVASPTVNFVTSLNWDSDLNANAYFSNSRSYSYNLGTQTTSNTTSLTVSDYIFDWSFRNHLGQVIDPSIFVPTQSLYLSEVLNPAGSANVFYDGAFTRTMTFLYTNFSSDPYQTVPTSNVMQATFPYSKTAQGAWTTRTLTNLENITVNRATKYITNTGNPIQSNVLTGYMGMRFTGVSAASNAAITYVGPGGVKYYTNITPAQSLINIGPSSFYYVDNEYNTISTTTTCSRIGTALVFSGPIPIYSVNVAGVDQVHDPIPGFSNVVQFTGITQYPVQFSGGLTITGQGTGRVDDRTQWVAGPNSIQFYGLTEMTCLTAGITKVNRVPYLSNITAEFDRNLIVLSDSTPWQTYLSTPTLYFTGEYWTLTQNLWPTSLTVTLYDSNNVGTTISDVTATDFRARLATAGYTTGVSTLTFRNCAYLVCQDKRSRLVLGLGSNVILPVTYYQSPSVTLDVGGRPAYSNAVSIPSIVTKPCTDRSYSVYTASNTAPWIIQVKQDGTCVACDTTGVLTPNGSIAPQKNYVLALTELSNVYFLSSDGYLLTYDTNYEFGQVGSLSTRSLAVTDVYSAVITNRYIVTNQKSTSNLFFTDKTTYVTRSMMGYGQPDSILVWDGSRYIYVMSQVNSNVIIIDTILYTDPTFVNGSMLIEYAILSDDERNWFQRTQNDHLMKQVQVYRFEIKPNITEAQFDLKLKNLVSELLFTIDDDNIEAVALYFNGVPIIDYDDAGCSLSLSKIQPFENHRRIPDRPFFMYSFAKNPSDMNPTGFVNMSRIVEQTVYVRVTPSNTTRTFTVWADSYNIIRFRDGLAGILYDYSTQ